MLCRVRSRKCLFQEYDRTLSLRCGRLRVPSCHVWSMSYYVLSSDVNFLSVAVTDPGGEDYGTGPMLSFHE